MRKYALYIAIASTVATHAQSVSYSHDAAKMNQITVAEIGSGSLTPSLYYDLLHSNYASSAAVKNKLSFRTAASIAAYQQVDDATALDSAMIKRAEVEALNVADRQIDLAWQVEGDKINNKMSDFKTNINRILQVGGTSSQQYFWTQRYNMLTTAITTVKSAYLPNAQRKKQYLAIYADAAKFNELLVKYLMQLSNCKTTAELLAATYSRDNKNATIAAEALSRWRDAGWSVGSSKSSGNGIIIGSGGITIPGWTHNTPTNSLLPNPGNGLISSDSIKINLNKPITNY
jgi:hypothetical protein